MDFAYKENPTEDKLYYFKYKKTSQGNKLVGLYNLNRDKWIKWVSKKLLGKDINYKCRCAQCDSFNFIYLTDKNKIKCSSCDNTFTV